jgi:hypothetical protein
LAIQKCTLFLLVTQIKIQWHLSAEMASYKQTVDNWQTEAKFLAEARDSSLPHSVRTDFVNYLAWVPEEKQLGLWEAERRPLPLQCGRWFILETQKDVLQCMHQQITQWTVLLYTGVSVANCRCVYLIHYVDVPSTLPQQHHEWVTVEHPAEYNCPRESHSLTGISGSSPDMDRHFRFKPWTSSWR